MLQPIRLETASGELVTTDAAILPYAELPAAVVWGTRFFIAHNRLASPPVYRETFVGYVVSSIERSAA